MDNDPTRFSAAVDADIVKASLKAVVSALNRNSKIDARDAEVDAPELAAA